MDRWLSSSAAVTVRVCVLCCLLSNDNVSMATIRFRFSFTCRFLWQATAPVTVQEQAVHVTWTLCQSINSSYTHARSSSGAACWWAWPMPEVQLPAAAAATATADLPYQHCRSWRHGQGQGQDKLTEGTCLPVVVCQCCCWLKASSCHRQRWLLRALREIIQSLLLFLLFYYF